MKELSHTIETQGPEGNSQLSTSRHGVPLSINIDNCNQISAAWQAFKTQFGATQQINPGGEI